MCLHDLAKFRPCKVGYKVMKTDSKGNLRSEYYNEEVVPQNVWLDEKDFRYPDRKRTISGLGRLHYPFGWHIYHVKKQALEHIQCMAPTYLVCVKVELREPVAVGYQSDKRVTVAKQIKILNIVS